MKYVNYSDIFLSCLMSEKCSELITKFFFLFVRFLHSVHLYKEKKAQASKRQTCSQQELTIEMLCTRFLAVRKPTSVEYGCK